MDDETVFEKVEDLLADLFAPLLAEDEPLEGWTIDLNRSTDDAIDTETQVKTLVIATTSIAFQQFEELNQDLVTQVIEFEFVQGGAGATGLRRLNLRASALVHGLIAADPTLGGVVQDALPVDMASGAVEGRDVNAVSLQYRFTYFTPRNDWFTIIGAGGVEH